MSRSRTRPGKTALAASFVVTFAAGCDSRATAPPAAPTVDVGAPTAPSASAAPAASAAPSASDATTPMTMPTVPATASAALPAAPAFGHVTRRDDGTCMWFADVQCPRAPNGRIIPCNPPPPHRVQCAGDAGP